MRVYFIRHGKTDGNEERFFQDPSIPLSKKGREDTLSLVKRFNAIPAEVILTSGMQRAKETSELFASQKNIEVVILDNLEEIHRSNSLYGKRRDDPEALSILNEWWEHIDDTDWQSKQKVSESYEEFHARASQALHQITQRKEKEIVVVTHSVILRLLLGLMLFEDSLTPKMFEKLFFNLKPRNVGLTVAEYSEESGWKILAWNDCSHLD